MKTAIVIDPEAEADIAEAHDWYQLQRRGLGAEFLLSLEAALEAISDRPRSFPKVRKQARRALLPRFPYFVLFIEFKRPSLVLVVGVFHTSRNPKIWKGRLR